MSKLWASAVAGAFVAAVAGSASASVVVVPPGTIAPNYLFPDGSKGFAFTTQGGSPHFAHPGVLVGFNPQPDPPGDVTSALLHNPFVTLSNGATGAYTLEFALTGFGPGGIGSATGGAGVGKVNVPPAPNSDGNTVFATKLDGHSFEIAFSFAPDPGSWVGFNPQPDPPGDVLGVSFNYPADADLTFRILEDGNPLTLASAALSAAPEPGTWALMMVGMALVGAALRRRREEDAALPA